MWLERGLNGTGTKTLDDAVQLIFGRTFEGWTGPGRNYFELHQEYAHLSEIHWRPEKRAYCHFNEHGVQRGQSLSVLGLRTRDFGAEGDFCCGVGSTANGVVAGDGEGVQ